MMIPHSRPVFDDASLRAVQQAIASGYTAKGPLSEALEIRVSQLTKQRYGAAVDSGTSALMLALFALQCDAPLRRVGIPAYACRVLFHAVRASGAEPVLMDCAEDLRLNQSVARALAPSLDAVILVHPFGLIEPMVAEVWPCPVIEDIAQAAGGFFEHAPLGSFGEIGIASFYATKPWGGAYGGMVLSNRDDIYQRVCHMRHADTAGIALPYAGNHQLSDVHAALVMDRLTRAEEERQARMALAEQYDAWLARLAAEPVRRDATANHYRYIMHVDDAAKAIAVLASHAVGAARPVETQLGELTGEMMPGAVSAHRHCVSIPLLADMTEKEKNRMYEGLQACL